MDVKDCDNGQVRGLCSPGMLQLVTDVSGQLSAQYSRVKQSKKNTGNRWTSYYIGAVKAVTGFRE